MDLDDFAEAVDRGDSAWVRLTLADPSFRATIEAADQTVEVLQSIGQAEALDGDLRRDAFREAIERAARRRNEVEDEASGAARSAILYDLNADYLAFLEVDYLLHRLATLPAPDRNNPAPLNRVRDCLLYTSPSPRDS